MAQQFPDAYRITIPPDDAEHLDQYAREKRRLRYIEPDHHDGDDGSQYDHDRLGAYGHYAASVLYGMPMRWDPRREADHNDGLLHGATVEVKTTRPHARLLLFRDLDHFKADVAILALGDPQTRVVEIAGWVTREEFKRRHTIATVTQAAGPQPALDRDRLNPPETLLPYLQGCPTPP